METYHVQLQKEQLVFSAAHFITFAGNVCERLHGHNYGVKAEVWGPLDENQYVVDFIALRDNLQQIVGELDHHVLLPTKHPSIHVHAEGEEIIAMFQQKRWVFPLEDCVLLPVSNTTAELIAQYVGRALLARFGELDIHPQRLSIGIDENHGQWGIWDSGDMT